MKPHLPTGRTGQLSALCLPVLALAALWLGVAMPLIEWHDDRDAVLMRRMMLADRMDALVAELPKLREQVATVANNGAGEPALLEGDSDSMASASLQERLQVMFLQAGVRLNSVETVPGEDAGAFRRIRLRISFNSSWPVLLVDELQVQPALHRISTAPGTYDITCSVFAFRSGAIGVAAR